VNDGPGRAPESADLVRPTPVPADLVRPTPEPEPQARSWLAVRWRQARNPPPPVFRAVIANLIVASLGGAILIFYDVLLSRGVAMPGGDLRTPLTAIYVVVVLAAGSFLTYLWVELPSGASGARRRSGWAALLGLFAGIPITYLTLVVCFQIIRPALG